MEALPIAAPHAVVDVIDPDPPPGPARAGPRPLTVLDDDGFARFCRDHHARLANALSWSLGDPDLGAEAADEAMTRAYERWDRVQAMANPAGWAYRTGLNWGRRRRWRRGRERGLLGLAPRSEAVEDRFADPDLARALRRLPADQLAVVVLRHLLGHSEQETAAALDIAPGTVKSRLSRGLERLRNELETKQSEA